MTSPGGNSASRDFRSEAESELDLDHGVGSMAEGVGDKLCDRLDLPHGVVGVESCRLDGNIQSV